MLNLLFVFASVSLAAPDRDALLDETRRRLVVGDFEGAQIVAEEVLQSPGQHQEDAQYLWAMSLEYQGDFDRAVETYDALMLEVDEGRFLDDIAFRRAETLGKATRFDEALDQLEALDDDAARTPADRIKMELLRGLWLVESRKGEKEGLTLLFETLEQAATIDARSHQALARARLAELSLGQSLDIQFRGPSRRKGKQMEERASLLGFATRQLTEVIRLDSPRDALPLFLQLGQAYEAFGEAMLDETRVRRLNDEQRAIYEEERTEKVIAVWVNASRFYDRGHTYALNMSWEGPDLEALRLALSEVVERIDALDEPQEPKSNP